MATSSTTGWWAELSDKLRHDTAKARVARARLIADEERAWHRYTDAVAEVLRQLEHDVEEGKASLELQRASRVSKPTESVHKALDRARATVDEVRVQGDLVALEARDRLAPARKAAAEALIEVRATLERFAQALRHEDAY